VDILTLPPPTGSKKNINLSEHQTNICCEYGVNWSIGIELILWRHLPTPNLTTNHSRNLTNVCCEYEVNRLCGLTVMMHHSYAPRILYIKTRGSAPGCFAPQPRGCCAAFLLLLRSSWCLIHYTYCCIMLIVVIECYYFNVSKSRKPIQNQINIIKLKEN